MDEELEEMEQRPVARRRVAESRPGRGGLSLGTQFMLILGITLVAGVSIMIWVSQRTISPTIKHVTDALSSYGWLWMLLLIVTAIGAAIGLLRRFGFIKFIEDVVVLGLRVHRHFVDAGRLKADKIGNYEIPLDKQGNPIYIQPGNPAFAPQAPLLPSMGLGASRRVARATTQVSEVDSPTQQLGSQPQGTIYLPGPQQVSQQTQVDIPRVKTNVSPIWGEEELMSSAAFIPTFTPMKVPGPYDFREELRMFKPSPTGVFMGRADFGPLLLSVDDLWHIVMTGPTGGGKSTIRRMVMAQLMSFGALCYLSDKHYYPYDEETGLDWVPIEERLAAPLIRDSYETYQFVEALANKELQDRIDRKYESKPIGPAIFFFIEELPAIVDERRDIVPLLAKILREGRKYKICFCGAAQDVLVQTIGTSSGVRENIRTGYYTGGDANSAKVILDLQNGEKVDESRLGQGLVYVKTTKHRHTLARIPWPSNDSVQTLMDASPLPVRKVEHIAVPRDESIDAQRRLTLIKNEGVKLTEEEIAAAYEKWANEGQSSIRKLEDALGVTHYKATKLAEEMKRRQLIS